MRCARGFRSGLKRRPLGIVRLDDRAVLPRPLAHPRPKGLGEGETLETIAMMLAELLAMVEAGTLAPVLDRVYPLSDLAEAHRYIHARRNIGKVLLTA